MLTGVSGAFGHDPFGLTCRHTGWTVALEDMKKSTDKADREPTRPLKNGRKGFTGDYQKMVKDRDC
jgi:hypothetical protein